MVLHSTRWLALSYFTYFFSYGIFLPFWSVWLAGNGLTPETIGILLGAGLVARFLGSLLIAPRVSDPSRLIAALRVLALLTLLFALAFWAGSHVAWLLAIIIGFNLFFSPLVPLTDALANTWQKQITMDYGRVRLWGSIAFVIGSALTGKLVSLFDYRAILLMLSLGVASMLLGMLLKPSVMPQGASRPQQGAGMAAWLTLVRQSWRFLACVCLLQGAHAAYYGFSAIYWQQAGYSASAVGYLWSLGVVAEVVIFALSKKVFRRFSARDLLLLLCPVRAGSLDADGLDHSAAGAYPRADPSLRDLYGVSSGGDALYRRPPGQRSDPPAGRLLRGGDGREYCHHDRLRRFPLSAPAPGRILGDGPADAPCVGYTAKSGGGLVLEHRADMLLLAFGEAVLRVDQRR